MHFYVLKFFEAMQIWVNVGGRIQARKSRCLDV